MLPTVRLLALLSAVSMAASAWAQAESPPEASPITSGGRLGVGIISMTAELRAFFGAPADLGVLVDRVEPGGAAEAAGIEVGDVITFFEGEPIGEPSALVHAVRPRAGQTVTLTLLRDRSTIERTATVTEGPDEVPHDGHPHVTFRYRTPEGDEIVRSLEDLARPIERGHRELLDRIDELERRLIDMEDLLEQLAREND